MTAAADFRALLAASSPLVAAVGNRIALNAVPEGAAYPLVVFTTTETPEYGLATNVLGTQVVHGVQCWAADSTASQALAALVATAIAANKDYAILSRGDVFDEALELAGVEITVDRWIV